VTDAAAGAAGQLVAAGAGEIAKRIVTRAVVKEAGASVSTTIRGTNEPGQVTSRGSWRKATEKKAWEAADDGPTGGKLCPTCGGEVHVPPHTGVDRDWHMSHNPSWTNREFPADVTRKEVLDNYNSGVSLECPICNIKGSNNDARFQQGPDPGTPH
jgi:HNH/ENDO VII superfamily nuclease with conserved GHE residues